MAKLESTTLFPYQCGLYLVARGPCFILKCQISPRRGRAHISSHALHLAAAFFKCQQWKAVLTESVSVWGALCTHHVPSPPPNLLWALEQTCPRAAFFILEANTSGKKRRGYFSPFPWHYQPPQKKLRTLPEAFKMPVFLHSFFST